MAGTVIAIPIKPGDATGPIMPSDPGADMTAQEVVAAVSKLPEDDLTTLIAGISPDALSVMAKVPELAPLAKLLQSAPPDAPDAQAPVPGMPPAPTDARSSVAAAMRQNGVR